MPLILVLLLGLAAIFVEIAGLIFVGSHLGIMPTLLLLVMAMLAGIILLRLQGGGLMRRIAQELERDQVPDRSLVEGMMMVMASILLIIPGFISDVIGILLFLAPVRAVLWRYLARYVTSSAKFYTRSGRSYTRPGPGEKFKRNIIDIDLDGQDYHEHGNEKSPWRRDDNEKNSQ